MREATYQRLDVYLNDIWIKYHENPAMKDY